MPNKMLIDASHQEETRVVVTRGSRIEEFDFESQDKKQIRGNIYLARVTRVEPSLQAAFVEYGGNRHGFLAFSEIHPDYYQIPVADRQALLRAEAEAAAEEDEDEDGEERSRGKRRRGGGRRNGEETARTASTGASGDAFPPDSQTASQPDGQPDSRADDAEGEAAADAPAVVGLDDFADGEVPPAEGRDGAAASEAGEAIAPASEALTERGDQPVEEADAARAPSSGEPDDDDAPRTGGSTMAAEIEADVVSEPAFEAPESGRGSVEEVSAVSSDEVESVGAEDALEEVQSRRRTPRRHYKIQEVVKRRQILLVQVVKEERGNKGAALTTYLSLAGRYSVLMPNTARGGGISRKITDAQDRKRLKDVVKDLDVPQGMGVILRTAGENRTKPEIKRDYEYLMRLWENVRGLTLRSIAPALVYEEGSLIKRSVRDLYNKDIDEILVAGEDGYREAKDFMRMLMPSHAKMVQPYRDPTPIFAKNGIESQLDRMLQPQVTLKSGGYIVINQTEALVSIDVNSGRSTREHSIEDTALQTNLEASEEVARQLRLRDLAGLIVIDYIDMEENRNNRAVEKKLKDCLKNDRARIQVGRISHFGLMEMSRQRIRSSVLESTMKPCPHCGGTGHVRSDSSVALLVLRAIEEFLLKDSQHHIAVKTPAQTAFYLLNAKRGTLVGFEHRFGVAIAVEADETVGHQHYVIVRGAVAEKPLVPAGTEALAPPIFDEPEDEIVEDETVEEAEAEDAAALQGSEALQGSDQGADDRKPRRKRRRRGGGREREGSVATDAVRTPSPATARADAETAADASEPAASAGDAAAEEASDDTRKRRRGKRGGRRNRREDGDQADVGPVASHVAAHEVEGEDAQPVIAAEALPTVEAEPDEEAVPAAGEVETSVSTTDLSAPSLDDPEAPGEVADSADGGGSLAAAVLAEDIAVEAPSDAEPFAASPNVRPSRRRTSDGEGAVEPVVSSQDETPADATAERPKKAGWWQRKGFF